MANYASKRIRIASNEEKRMIRRIVVALTFSAMIIGILIVGGIPAIISVSSVIDRMKGSDQANVSAFNSPLLTPRIAPLDTATNSAKILVTGSGQEGTQTELFVNDQAVGQQLIGKDGEFSFDNVQLKLGSNTIYAQSKTSDGKASQPSIKHQITYDDTPPKLDITGPQDGQIFTGVKEIKVSGTTEPQASVTVNDNYAIISQDGSFSYTLQVPLGEIMLKIVATDEAGNQTTLQRRAISNP